MSKIIPPLLSSSPPPMVGVLDEDEDDDFGDFAAANIPYGCDALSLPSSPTNTRPEATSNTDNSNIGINQCIIVENKTVAKDFQDKRKEDACDVIDSQRVKTKMCNGTGVKEDYNSSFQYFPDIPPDIVCDNKDDVNIICEESDDFQDFTNAETYEDSDNLWDDSKIQLHCLENTTVLSQVTEDTLCTNLEPAKPLSDVTVSPNEYISESLSETVNNSVLNVPSEISEEPLEYNECQGSMGSMPNDFDDTNQYINHCELQLDMNEITTENEEVQSQLEEPPSRDVFINLEKSLEDHSSFDQQENVDDFGEFESTPSYLEPDENIRFMESDNMDTNFGDFENQVFEEQPEISSNYTRFNSVDRELNIEDDDEFNDFTSHTQPPINENNAEGFCEISDWKIASEKATEILIQMFPPVQEGNKDFQRYDYTVDDVVFGRLKDITDTYALSYQWGKSTSQKSMLKALNIDTRNILYGPRWNESIPRYAATLGFQPLEPVKSDAVTPPVLEPIPVASVSQNLCDEPLQQVDIPSAQFDWVSAGLTNPLETATSKVETDKIQESSHYDSVYLTSTIVNKNNSEAIDFDLPVEDAINEVQNDSELVKSLQLTERIADDTIIKSEPAVDFPVWQSPLTFENDTNWSFNPTLLRETHITSNATNNISLVQCKNLDSTSKETNWTKPVTFVHNTDQVESPESDFDEFADFQTGVPLEVHTRDLDDEFTDFQSTLPSTLKSQEPLQHTSYNMLEPLKATILLPIVSSGAPASINWPDPGVTDIDLGRFELNYKADPNIQNEPSSVEKDKHPIKSVEGNKSLDEDDWSDFVTNQGAQNLTKNSQNQNRIVTTDLQRPLHHLTEVRTMQQSVPIATQQNVFQTKVLSNFEPLVHSSVQQAETYPQNGSILTNHFHQDLVSRNVMLEKPLVPEINSFQSKPSVNSANNFMHSQETHSASNEPEETDEEWSDFVSNPTVQPSRISNKQVIPTKLNFDWNQPPQFTSWSTSVTPNIITNPGSFDSFQSYASPVPADLFKNRSTKKTPNVVIQPNRGPIQSISSVPELEFISSKNKTWKK